MTFPYQTILLLGGTGTLGQALCRFFLEHTDSTIRIFSRGELLQAQMEQSFNSHPRVRWMLGDVRDLARLNLACYGVDLVVHAAALKHITKGQYNPTELLKTNIQGTHNVITACWTMGVKRAIFVSTDKAVAPCNAYGASKNFAECLWTCANAYSPTGTSYSVVRYGNLAGSRGSILPYWQAQRVAGQPLTLTSPLMTRFHMDLADAVQLVWFAAQYAPRGSVLVPHLPAYHVTDLLQAVWGEGEAQYVMTGVRPGEKLHESLLGETEGASTLLYSHAPHAMDYYCVPPVQPSWAMPPWEDWVVPEKGTWEPWPVEQAYRSDKWPYRLGVPELRARLEDHT